MKIRSLLALSLGALFCVPWAEVAVAGDDPLVTDRPDFTESAVTVTRGRTQIEMGYTFSQFGAYGSLGVM